MKYNAVENAERFITEQIEWAKTNGYGDFIIWSNGEELQATLTKNDLVSKLNQAELEKNGYWKAIQFEHGYRVEW